jgi:hypothetical protein
MHHIETSRPKMGTWVFWVTVEQATGRMTQGLNLWSESAEDVFAGEEGLDLFWTSAENVAQAHLKGQLVERQQQINETEEQLENLHQITSATAKMLAATEVSDA